MELTNIDPAGKCKKSFSKFKENIKDPTTSGAKELYNLSTYPGLGKLKQFQIMNHIEMVANLLNGKN